jgi:hypothetical protein
MKKDIKNLQIKLCYPVEEIFDCIMNHITDIKTDDVKYPNDIFYFSNEKYIANYNQKYNSFWCNYYSFWPKFELNNLFNYLTIRNLLNSMIEEHFKLKDITMKYKYTFDNDEIEEHFKLKDITTQQEIINYLNKVEKHFKLKDIRTSDRVL